MISVQDALWTSKCMRHGWFLPYEPTPNEYGAWKQHYIACVQSLDVEFSGRTIATANTVHVIVFRTYILLFEFLNVFCTMLYMM